jgi:hypothetical protein
VKVGVEGSYALCVWAASALLLILVSVPIFSTVLPPLFDYPNHLARMHLLREGGNAFYAVRWAALPNLAQDLIVPLLARLMPLELASKLFLVAIFGLIAGGTIWLNRVATGAWRMWPLLGFLLLYNRVFLWGFVNYLFGIGLALIGVALWLSLEPKRVELRVLASVAIALACYFSHIAAFGVYVLAIFGVELLPAVAEWRASQRAALARRIAIASAQFVTPAVISLLYIQQTGNGPVSYPAFWRKFDLLFSVFDNYDRAFDIACFVLFVGLLGWLAYMRRLQPARRLGCAVAVVFAAYLLLPSQALGGFGLDRRLPIAVFLLLIAASAPIFPSRRAAAMVGIVAAMMLIARSTVIEHVWRQADRVYSSDLAGIDALPRGAKLAIATSINAVHVTAVPRVHLAAMAVARREAFVQTIFAEPGQQPLALNPPYAELAASVPPEQFWAAIVDADRAMMSRLLPVLQQYDYVVVAAARPVSVPSNRCLERFFDQPGFQIFTILHDPGCMGSAE